MKITKEKWKKIQDYLCNNSKEIWRLAVDNASGVHNGLVWLEGIEDGNFQLSAMPHKAGTEYPAIKDAIFVYELPYDWYKDFMDFLYPKDVFTVPAPAYDDFEYDEDEVVSRLYDTGYEYFLEAMGENFFWKDIIRNNNIEFTGGKE